MEKIAAWTSWTDRGAVSADRVRRSRRTSIGCVVGAHGLGGALQVRILGDGPDHLLNATHVMLGAGVDDPNAVATEVLRAAPGRADEVRMTLAGVEDREAATKLRGTLVMMDADELGELEAGEYYEFQLVGCRVEAEDGSSLGTVREIWPTGASDLLVIENEEGGQHLIPTGGDFLREVDVDERRIVVALIPGLLDPL